MKRLKDDGYGPDNPGPGNNPDGLLTQMPFWLSAKRRWLGFKLYSVVDRTNEDESFNPRRIG